MDRKQVKISGNHPAKMENVKEITAIVIEGGKQ